MLTRGTNDASKAFDLSSFVRSACSSSAIAASSPTDRPSSPCSASAVSACPFTCNAMPPQRLLSRPAADMPCKCNERVQRSLRPAQCRTDRESCSIVASRSASCSGATVASLAVTAWRRVTMAGARDASPRPWMRRSRRAQSNAHLPAAHLSLFEQRFESTLQRADLRERSHVELCNADQTGQRQCAAHCALPGTATERRKCATVQPRWTQLTRTKWERIASCRRGMRSSRHCDGHRRAGQCGPAGSAAYRRGLPHLGIPVL